MLATKLCKTCCCILHCALHTLHTEESEGPHTLSSFFLFFPRHLQTSISPSLRKNHTHSTFSCCLSLSTRLWPYRLHAFLRVQFVSELLAVKVNGSWKMYRPWPHGNAVMWEMWEKLIFTLYRNWAVACMPHQKRVRTCMWNSHKNGLLTSEYSTTLLNIIFSCCYGLAHISW